MQCIMSHYTVEKTITQTLREPTYPIRLCALSGLNHLFEGTGWINIHGGKQCNYDTVIVKYPT